MSDTSKTPSFPALDVPPETGNGYPPPHDRSSEGRQKRKLGNHGGITNFGVNHVTLPAGSQSALRHWHTRQDEFVMVLTGELVLLTDAGERVLGPGDCAAFPKGTGDGHALQNRSSAEATYLEVGDRSDGDEVDYSDVDMAVRWIDGQEYFVRRSDGSVIKKAE